VKSGMLFPSQVDRLYCISCMAAGFFTEFSEKKCSVKKVSDGKNRFPTTFAASCRAAPGACHPTERNSYCSINDKFNVVDHQRSVKYFSREETTVATSTSQVITDPRSKYPTPEFPEQQQVIPGSDQKMNPQAKHGEDSYEGHGK